MVDLSVFVQNVASYFRYVFVCLFVGFRVLMCEVELVELFYKV